MCDDPRNALKSTLLKEYGHFADKRIKKIETGHLFIVDDRRSTDHGADGKPFGWFCLIFADVVSAERIKVILRGGVPSSVAIDGWTKKYKADHSAGQLSFYVTPSDVGKLGDLARAIRLIVKPGARYPVPAYKYVCPRTAASLERLRAALVRSWKI
jgi:hypothetical protein